MKCRVSFLLVLPLVVACASTPSRSTPKAEVALQEPGEELCKTLSSAAAAIMISRHLFPHMKARLALTMRVDYPHLRNTMDAFVDDAYSYPRKEAITQSSEDAVHFMNKWTADLGVCDDQNE